MMEWQRLLTRQRLGKLENEKTKTERTCFQQDYDRIVFSSPFRRLKDKTQVYSLSQNDYIRTRLTHSVEVSCVGRSLGTMVGEKIIKKYPNLEKNGYTASDFGNIVSAACLAHDIGNPPFGHAGEEAIQCGFKEWNHITKNKLCELHKKDFQQFEGNAQGFRILTKLEMRDRDGGMQLTYPTLAAFTKYPRISSIPEEKLENYSGKSSKKYGFFQAEKDIFARIAETLGLIPYNSSLSWWLRHPLAFLVEAADDICYRIVDLEDGYRMGFISFSEAQNLLNQIAEKKPEKIQENANSDQEIIKYLRAVTINKLVEDAAKIFYKVEEDILQGKFDEELLAKSKYNDVLKEIKQKTKRLVFNAPEVIKVQIAGYEVLSELFIEFANAVLEKDKNGKSKLLFGLLPEEYHPLDTDDEYNTTLKVTDYISGMTDSYATNLFQTIKGISIKSQNFK